MPTSHDVGFVIDDSTNNDILNPAGFGKGFEPEQIPTDLAQPYPLFGEAPDQIREFTDAELLAYTQELWDRKATLWHMRQYAANGQQMPTLDQGSEGYCWAYSTTRAIMYARAMQNQPYRRLSGHAIGCIVKNYRNEGGWCGLSQQFAEERGVPSVEFWPEKSSNRANDNPRTWENAAQNKISEGWYDPSKQPYDRNMTLRQLLTLLCLGIPCAVDRFHWSHSTNDHTPIIKDGRVWPMGDNSWTDGWGDKGCYVFVGSKANPDGCIAVRAVPAGIS